MTLNLWCRHGSWSDRRSVLIDGFRNVRPDIVAFQEAVKTDHYDQVADILGAEYFIFHQEGRWTDGSGATIASRWPFRDVREHALPVTARVNPVIGWIGSVTVAEILVPNPIGSLLFVHHKPTWQWGFERERELQAVAAARYVEEVIGQRRIHVVLAGDFDATPEAASVRFWQGKQSLEGTSVCYADAWESAHPGEPGHSFTPRNPLVATGEMPLERGRRIDYILVRCTEYGPTLDVTACTLAFDAPANGVWASDHFGVIADLTIPKQGEVVRS